LGQDSHYLQIFLGMLSEHLQSRCHSGSERQQSCLGPSSEHLDKCSPLGSKEVQRWLDLLSKHPPIPWDFLNIVLQA